MTASPPWSENARSGKVRATASPPWSGKRTTTPLAVSRKVGYREGDAERRQRQDTLAWHRRLVLSTDDFVRGEPVQVVGAEPLQAFFARR